MALVITVARLQAMHTMNPLPPDVEICWNKITDFLRDQSLSAK